MAPLTVTPLRMQQLIEVDSWKMRLTMASDAPTIHVVAHLTFAATTMLISPPRNMIWRVPIDFRSRFPQRWEDLIGRELVDEGLALRELAALGIGKRAMPGGFWTMYQGDEYEDERRRIDLWNIVVMVPNSLVEHMISYLQSWVQQAKELCFSRIEDREYAKILALGQYESYKTQGEEAWALNTHLSTQNAGRWSTPDGMVATLRRLVEVVNKGQVLHLHPIATQNFDALGVNRELAGWAEAALKSRRLEPIGSTPVAAVSLATIDLIFSLRARLVRLLGWPQHYRALLRESIEQQRLAERLPFTPGLPFNPLAEIRAYLRDMEVRFPVVLSDPFPDGVCPVSLRSGEPQV